MTREEMADEREILIGQGLDMPNLDDEYYDHDDKFDTYSCATGDYRSSIFTDGPDSVIIKLESDLDSDTETLHSDSNTLYDTSDMTSQFAYSSASTPLTTPSQIAPENGQKAVVVNPVGVNNAHEGMSYDLLIDGPEVYDYSESVVQTGKIYNIQYKTYSCI